MITAQIESFHKTLPELAPLLPVHWEELGLYQDKMPLDPAYGVYFDRENRGELLFVTVREDGRLIGYWISVIAPGLHYKTTLTNTMDILYVAPEHRGNDAGFLLADLVKAESIRRGVRLWWVGSKNHKQIEWFFERLGFERQETYFSMWLGDE